MTQNTTLRASKQIGPNLPGHQTNFPYPGRLRAMWHGCVVNHNTGVSYTGAQAEMTDSEMAQIAANFDHVGYSFTIEEMTVGRNNPTLLPEASQTIAYTVQRFMQYGIKVFLKADSTGTARKDLCGDNGTSGVWTQANWNQYLINLFKCIKGVAGVSPETVWLGTGNEMGLNCTNRSMTYYNGFLRSAIPALRSVAPDYTIVYDLYPTATPLDYRWDEQYANPPGTPGYVTMVRPSDLNTVADLHTYWQNMFSLDQGKNDTSPSGMRWIYGFPWGLDRPAFIAWMLAHPPVGYHTGNALLDAQYDWWCNVNNVATVVDGNGINEQSLYNQMAGLIAWATTNKVALYCGEHGTADITQSQNFTPAEVDLANYTGAVTKMLHSYGIGNSVWQWSNVSDGNAGSRVANATAIARNKSRVAPL